MRILLFLLGLSFGMATSAEPDERKLLILGDSLSAAHGMALDQGWPALLQDRLDENGQTVRVVNASISGETTSGGLTRLPKLLEQHQPSIVMVELGANDALRGYPPTLIRNNIEQMVRLSQASGAEVILLGITVPVNYGTAYRDQFAAVYDEVAAQYRVRMHPFFLDGVATDPDLMLADGIHPNPKAQPIILETVWTLLHPVLDGLATSQG